MHTQLTCKHTTLEKGLEHLKTLVSTAAQGVLEPLQILKVDCILNHFIFFNFLESRFNFPFGNGISFGLHPLSHIDKKKNKKNVFSCEGNS